ncbi:MAG TPA: glucoamylase family protein [Gemmatimonadaceae bacterium]|nr:glucoamylase family protein [Gemmatimonadaceae bacterium]
MTSPTRWSGLLSRLTGRSVAISADGTPESFAGPIRGELLGTEGLAEHARALGRAQRIVPPTPPTGWRLWPSREGPLLNRLDDTRRVLEQIRQRVNDAAEQGADVSPAGEWLLDNFYVVQEHIREVRAGMPKGYYQELPKLAAGALAGYPRIYEIAIELIAHTEGFLQLDNIQLFVREFQRAVPLTVGELWATPTMLRLGLIENVRRMAVRVTQRLDEMDSADQWAKRLREASEGGAQNLSGVMAEFVNHHPPLTPAFITRFLQQIRSYQTNFVPLQWLEQWIAEDGLNAEDAVTRSNQRLALTQVMMANSITSLRTIARLDWSVWVETMSATETLLRQDPSGVFDRMTFRSRDHYRHIIENLAKGTGLVESDVTQRVLDLAQRGTDPQTRHIGYYLVGDGLPALQAAIGYVPSTREQLYRWVVSHANLVYFGGIAAGTLGMLLVALALIGPISIAGAMLVLLLALIPANDIAINIQHQLLNLLLPPRVLPKLDFEDGIPADCRSLVVVPTLLGSVDAVGEALEHLEVQFLANRDPRLHFALLSDFTDSPTEVRAGDEAIIQKAIAGIKSLNVQYATEGEDLFFLFHRARQWNARQGAWLAWERKRGKLEELNRYLRGGARDAFAWVVGDTAPLADVRYVITLDSDTVLPRGAAALLIGALAHPLNHGAYDVASGRVVRGYGILQPRVGISLESANRSLFASIASGHPGVDPYTTAVSDVYQDLFAEGSYTGKGIYDVDVFEQATSGRFPDNTLLSHDLIEGAYARAALSTDVEFYDDYPTRYLTYTRRKHRWIRGDWQLLRWLGPTVPGPNGPQPNQLSAISRWKIFDNLRRSVVEIAQLVLLVAGWTVLPGGPFLWTALVLAGMAVPWGFSLMLAIGRPPRDTSWRAYYQAVGRDMVTAFEQYMLAVIFLPHQAAVSADAIVRTLWRLLVTRRNLLEWQTASQVERLEGSSGKPVEVWRRMWPAVAVTAVVLALVVTRALHHNMVRVPDGMPGAGLYRYSSGVRWWYLAITMPLIALWTLSPIFAIALSRPAVRRDKKLTPAESWTALRYALLHWHYFDRFVTAETQWLAPDNYQEDPSPVVAMRTSPTNIGLQLLGIVSAYDVGFLPGGAMIERLELVFRSLERMTRFRGHFYNWYDLHDLRVLEPAYISTVDSGNLAGHLLALKQALYEVTDDPVVDTRVWDALQTALTLAAEELRALASSGDVSNPRQWQAVLEAGERVRAVLASLPQATGAKEPGRGVDVGALATLVERLRTAERILALRADDGGAVSSVVSAAAIVGAGGNGSGGDGSDGNGTVVIDDEDAIPLPPNIDRPSAVPVEGLDAAATGRIWLRWGRTLLERQVADLTALGIPLGESRIPTLRQAAATSAYAADQIKRLDVLAARAHAYAMEMDFAFLFDERRKLFSIGYAVNAGMLDASCYDLLASEARLASFVAIAKDDVSAEHWFRLGRALTEAAGGTALISWSGSMFEYLMPALVMESFPFTLLDQTYQGALQRQIAYGTERGVPWGVSESAYNARDRMQTYQYRAFGVPDLALKRGLDKDLVIAPYATALSLLVDPHAAMRNLSLLEREGALGPFGFRDAIDYTRPAVGATSAIVGAYMAHHIGMSLVALTNAIRFGVWPKRFHRDAIVKSAELILFERIPRRFILSEAQTGEADEYPRRRGATEKPAARQLDTASTPQPRVTLLGHAPYTVMITNAGSGYSRFEQTAVTRWRNDGTLDDSGQWCYVRDLGTGRVWSAAYQPTGVEPDLYRVTFASDRATFFRRDGDVDTRLEVTVVPDDCAEVRRVTVTNNGNTAREIELTTYGEICINDPDADRGHPAFQNLFIETEYVAGHSAILATRRPRSSEEEALWLVHVAAIGREAIGAVSCETDRARFIGRNGSARRPAALETDEGGALSGTTGAPLDPIFSLRTRVKVPAGQSVRVAFTTIVAKDRDQAMELADRYADPYSAQRALDLSWMHAQVELRELGITPADGALYQELAGYLLYSNPAVRVAPREIMGVRRGREALWAHGISGDWPILLATVDASAGVSTVKELLQAHHYWRLKGLTADLVLLNTYPPTYLQELNDELQAAIMASSESGIVDKPGGVFLRRRDLMPPDDLATLRAAARVHVLCDGLRLSEVLDLPETLSEYPPAFVPLGHAQTGTGIVSPGLLAAAAARSTPATAATRPALEFDNGIGGLLPDGTYEIRLGGSVTTPAPWTNCIANEVAGFLVSENGGGCTWVGSSQFYRLTPWRNDPVRDAPTEILYLRDDETGELWTPTPDPIRHATPYTVRHTAGRTEFRHSHLGISTTLALGMAGEDPVKIALLTITNDTAAVRRLTVTSYVEWTLGTLREHTQHEVRTVLDRETEALFAQNVTDPDFAGQVAFSAWSVPVGSFTADRREFLGRNGELARPAALERTSLSEVTGAAIDPCAVLQGAVMLAPGETRQIVVLLGAGPGDAEARRLVTTYRDVAAATRALEGSVAAWRKRLSAVRVRTPDGAFDAALNGWLLYQALSCRFWGRTALYQSSGAFGFRDQLQDSMAFVYAEPGLARAHILRSAARQFKEGDVQHWWHPHNEKGVRTRITDDLVWLPWVVDHYITTTGDHGILDETVPFLTMRELDPGEVEIYDTPQVSGETASLYEHCLRALRRATTVGGHGLPLMGTGDWNDGMNRVGIGGKGESVWLAWFIIGAARRFAAQCEARHDLAAARELRAKADAYAAAVERTSWDGAWYRRAYFDDGTPLGSASSEECQIDSIAQSWSVISGAGNAERARMANESLYTHLVRGDGRLIELLTPAFDKTTHDPGYIKGYLPGVRENGAQYTHAATWAVLARALLGEGDVAFIMYQMLNPFTHAESAADADVYKVEPFVIAADVYTAEGHLGRGGWTWYTGSASWAYRVGLEGILGVHKRGASLVVEPCIPMAWAGFEVDYRYGSATYQVAVQNPEHVCRGVASVTVDGARVAGGVIPLVDDGKMHAVVVVLGDPA